MSTIALAPFWAFVSPIALVRRALASFWGQADEQPRAHDYIRMLADLSTLIENDATDAFRGASPDEVLDRAEKFGRDPLLYRCAGFTLDIITRLGFPIPKLARDLALQMFTTIANDAEELTKLTPEARKHLRASAFLVISALERDDSDQTTTFSLLRDSKRWAIAEGQGEARILGLLQGVVVAGLTGTLPVAIVDRMALELWRLAREAADEDDVESAYWSAVAVEAEMPDVQQ